MTTLMEKDVALEMISAALGLLARKIVADRSATGLPPIEIELVKLRKHSYQCPIDDFDTKKITDFCRHIMVEYGQFPDHSLIWDGENLTKGCLQ